MGTSASWRGFDNCVKKCLKKTQLGASDLQVVFYALSVKGSVQIFTTYYAVFISFLCKTLPSFPCIHKCLTGNS